MNGPVMFDARGQRCPQPVIGLARLARGLAPGTRIEILTTDPAARHDIPAWAAMRGHDVEEAGPAPEGGWRTIVRLAG